MLKEIVVAGVVSMAIMASVCVVSAQSSAAKAQDLVSQLDKTKHKVKDKGPVHVEVYIEVRNEPVVMQPSTLTGRYVMPDDGEFMMDLNVAADGSATATGVDYETRGGNSVPIKYTLKGRVDGALLTGTQVFESGRQAPFEAVFVNHTVRNGRNSNDARVTWSSFGIGYIISEDTMTHRVFLEKK